MDHGRCEGHDELMRQLGIYRDRLRPSTDYRGGVYKGPV